VRSVDTALLSAGPCLGVMWLQFTRYNTSILVCRYLSRPIKSIDRLDIPNKLEACLQTDGPIANSSLLYGI
jgi:hypothetical protein